MSKQNLKGMLPSILFLVVTIFVFGPIELFCTNGSEFWFSFKDVLIIVATMAIPALVILVLIDLLLKGKAKDFFTALIFVLALALYIQGNYANIDYGVLDGNAIDWSAYPVYAVLDTIGWIALVGGLLVLWWKKPELFHKIQLVVSLFIIAIQVVTLAYLIPTSGALKTEEASEHYLSTEHLYEVSSEDNILVFVLDAFDEAYLQDIIADNPAHYKQLFKDFTHFDNACVAGARTKLGLPSLITGAAYPGDITYNEYVAQNFDADKLYSTLKENNYAVDIYTSGSFVPGTASDIIGNLVTSGYDVSSYGGLSEKYASLTMYKYMPHVLKPLFWLYTGDFDQYKVGRSGEHFNVEDDVYYYNNLVEQGLQLNANQNVFKLVHLNGPHPPYTMNEVAQTVADGQSSAIIQGKGSLFIMEEYINQLKELGVYDQAKIIILADHGDTDNGYTDPAHGILLVKEAGTKDAFTTSSAPVSYFDLHNTIFSMLGKTTGDTFFSIPENAERIRYFYQINSNAGNMCVDEYVVNGHLDTPGTRTATGVVLSPTVGSAAYTLGTQLTFGANNTAIPYIRSGVSGADMDRFSWTDQHEVEFFFDLGKAPKKNLAVAMDVMTIYDEFGDQTVQVYANDELVHEEVLTEGKVVTFDVPRELVPDQNLTLRLELPDAICPMEHFGPGNDGRTLALAIQGLNISESDTPVAGGDSDDGFSLTKLIGIPMTALLKLCNNWVGNFVIAIFLFTALTKIILLPVSLWVQKNSIIMVALMPELNRLQLKYYGDKETISDETQALYKREHYNPIASSIPMILQVVILMGVIDAVKNLLGGTDSILNAVPFEAGGMTLLMPVAAAGAALCLGLAQNVLNPLQKEQSKKDQWFTNGISIAISLILGAFVSVGTCVYWIASNLFTIPLQVLLNKMIKASDYVDYEALEQSREELEAIAALDVSVSKEDKKREKEDYKKFFSVANKHLVFYSEKSGFYKYFKDIIDYLMEHSNVIVHYVTSDPNDQIFEIAKTQPRIRPYYVGEKKLITLMMKMDADIVVSTTESLEDYYIKRSYVRKDVEYVYAPHSMLSTNMASRKGALDHFDTIMCVGQHQWDEVRETEAMYDLPEKKLIPMGYCMLDDMVEAYEKMPKEEHEIKRILIAPSWQEGNLLDSCIGEMVEQLYDPKHFVVVRPHPEYVKRYPHRVKALQEQFKDLDPNRFVLETDFSSNVSIYTADIVITDWSGIVQEFSYTTKKPSLMINTPMKVFNPDYTLYKNPPLDIIMRDKLGKTLNTDEIGKTRETVEELFNNADFYEKQITELMDNYVYNHGNAGRTCARYLLSQLIKKQEEQKQ